MSNLTPPITSGLVLALVPAARSLLDHSGAGRTVSQAGTPGDLKWVRRKGVDQLLAESTGRLEIPNDPTLQAVTDFSLFLAGDLVSLLLTMHLISKRGAATQMEVRLLGTQVNIYDGLNVRLLDLVDLSQIRSMCVTLKSGSIGNVSINGTPRGALSGISTITSTSDNVVLLNNVSGASPPRVTARAILLYDRVVTADEDAQNHEWSESLTSPVIAQDRRHFDMGSTVPNGDSGGVVASYDLGTVTKRQVADKSSHGNHGDLVGNCAPVFTEAGRALGFDGATARVELASDVIGSDPITISAVVWARSAGVAGRLVDNGKLLANFQVANVIAFSSDGGITNIVTPANILYDQWYHFAFTRDALGAGEIFVNGESIVTGDTGTPQAGTPVVLGNRAAANRGWDGHIRDAVLYNRILTPAEIKESYLKLARRVMFDSALELIRPTTRPYVVGEELPGTGLRVITGSFSIPEDSAGRYIECVTNGKLRGQLPGADNFHTHTFDATGATLTKNATNIEIDATAGDTIRTVLLTLGAV